VHHTIWLAGKLEDVREGMALGTVMSHDVYLPNGSLNLSRQDFAYAGRGPALALSRSYSPGTPAESTSAFGPGWRHSLEQRLEPVATEEMGHTPSQMTWVED
jgi:hypothetical protein